MKLYEKPNAEASKIMSFTIFSEKKLKMRNGNLVQKCLIIFLKISSQIIIVKKPWTSLTKARERTQTRGKVIDSPSIQEDHVRFFVNLGKNDGVNIKSFLENIAGSASVKRKELKNVVLKDEFSFLEVHKSHKNRFLKGKKLFFKKKALRFEVARTPGKSSSKSVK